jgi:collagenase-like PrtC family protease
MTKLELLAPARNLEYGKAAINCGADAIYMGASKFGARSAVGNSVDDILQMTQYAHKYNAKVYVALNTLIYDQEFESAIKIARQVWDAGADALIIQDMGLLEVDLPPIPLYASTQTHNATAEKVLFLEKVGIQRVILARELSINEIQLIRNKTKVELESFIHGAICVCYSGQCYLSQAVIGKSGNRGECAQLCRWDYNLKDSQNKSILQRKHLLSPKDLNLSDHLESLVDAGVTSFKVEGRLKDISYVKNITGWYRQQLDAVIAKKQGVCKSSSGRTIFDFTPDVNKTFNRGYTNYFIQGRISDIASINTPKSLGKPIGIVKAIYTKHFTIDTHEVINNGDGLCFIAENQTLEGFRVNRAEGNNLYPLEMPTITIGTPLFRNHDQKFENMLSSGQTLRKISVTMTFAETPDGIELQVVDEDGNTISKSTNINKELAQNPERTIESLKQALLKVGNTMFEVHEIQVDFERQLFIQSSVINELRRNALQSLEKLRLDNYKRYEFKIIPNSFPYPEKTLNYLGNIVNQYANKFYKRHGVDIHEQGFELQKEAGNRILMTTRYCLKFEMGNCPNEKSHKKSVWKSPYFIENNKVKLALDFDCKNCVMHVKLS